MSQVLNLKLAIVATGAMLGLAGCAETSAVADAIARDQAKSAVNGVVTARFPGMNAAPITDCIIDNASAGEILTVAGAAATGASDTTVQTVLEIAQRPATVTCISRAGLGLIAL